MYPLIVWGDGGAATPILSVVGPAAFLLFLAIFFYGEGLTGLQRAGLTGIAVIAAVISLFAGRLGHVVLERPSLFREPVRIFTEFQGLVFYPALFGFVLSFVALLRIFSCAPRRSWELLGKMALGLPLSYGLLRIGCFLAGCCWGHLSAVPWAVRYPFHTHSPMDLPGLPVHPVQLYDAAASVLLFAALVQIRKRLTGNSGRLLSVFFALYAVQRFVIEFFRGDRARGEALVGGLSTSQLISVMVLLTLAAIEVSRRFRGVAVPGRSGG